MKKIFLCFSFIGALTLPANASVSANVSFAPDYMDVSYAFGDISFSYGDYDTYGSNFLISYGFDCSNYDCSFAYSDFSSDSEDLRDEDALVFAVGASF